MFEPNSRYASLPIATHLVDGRELRYVRRRFLPRVPADRVSVAITVGDGDRLDLIAARSFGDPLAWWLIADQAEAMDPRELVEEPGRSLAIPLPL
ncbi:MAG: hypothetical protein AB1Z98_07140 [Nannocystaceae bacterium]